VAAPRARAAGAAVAGGGAGAAAVALHFDGGGLVGWLVCGKGLEVSLVLEMSCVAPSHS
jgi:hypothetical protein